MIVLFSEGTSRVHNGVTCDSMLVNEFGFEPYLEQGWVLDPKELYKDEGETQKVEKPVEKEAVKLATSKVATPKSRPLDSGSTTPKSGSSIAKK